MTGESGRDVPIDPGAASRQPAGISPERLAALGRALAADDRTRPIPVDALRSIGGAAAALSVVPESLRSAVIAAAEHEQDVSRRTHAGGGAIDVGAAVERFRSAGWVIWRRHPGHSQGLGEDPIEWHDDIDDSYDAHTVTAADYDDPDSMINRIDRALALHRGDTDGTAV